MSNGHAPRHNHARAEQVRRRQPLPRRVAARAGRLARWRWTVPILAGLLTAALVALAVLSVHHVGKVHSHDHGGHSHSAAAGDDDPTPHCDEALALADDGLKAAQQFGEDMASFHTSALALAQFLEPGDAGRPVRKLQKRLKEQGADIRVDGDYGPNTEAAVAEFRDKHGRHAEVSETFLSDLADTRKQYEIAKLGCQLEPPKATTGGGS